MSRKIIIIFGILTLVTSISSKSPSIVTVPKCVNFTDWRKESKSNELNLTNFIRENPSDDLVVYKLSGSLDFLTKKCNRIEVAKIMTLTEPWPERKVGTESLNFSASDLRYGGYITADGRYFDGLFYHNPTEFCVKVIASHPVLHSDWFMDILVCHMTPNSTEVKRAASCVPKCCRPNRIIDSSSGTCRALRQNEPAWTPKVCDKPDCLYENDYCRKGYGLGVGVRCGENSTEIPLSKSVRLETNDDKLQLQYLVNKKQWKVFDHPYCVDGFVSDGNVTYENNMNQIIVVCTKDAGEIKHLIPAPQLNVSSATSMLSSTSIITCIHILIQFLTL